MPQTSTTRRPGFQDAFVNGFLGQGEGDALASGATLTPTNSIHRITGSTQITTITVPQEFTSYGGTIVLIGTDSSTFTTATGGNIALASTGVRYKALHMTWCPGSSLWYPSY